MSIDQQIAGAAELQPIAEVAARVGLTPEDLIPYGHTKAKISLPAVAKLADRPRGTLILVTAMSPTPAGEGKTTTSVGLADGLNRVLGDSGTAVLALREPSLGPVFGMKGGATGGGYAQVVPMEDINLHFTGDFHAIGLANNLAAAALDNHIHQGNTLGVDARRVRIKRVMDMNDRALRQITAGLGGVSNGYPREDGFDIVVASEVMAIFCLATSLADLKARLGRIVVAETRERAPITVADLKVAGAMAALLRDAFAPNLVQTLEHTPAIIHGGPFANIAHGCNSIIATSTALALGDYVVTEAGFGADLGAEKFLDIKARSLGTTPAATVVVATVRALKYHGGVPKDRLGEENVEAVESGMSNLRRHLRNLREVFGQRPVVALNHFDADSQAEVAKVCELVEAEGVPVVVAKHWADGGAGAEELARAVIETAATPVENPGNTYPLEAGLLEKAELIATRIYGASGVEAPAAIKKRLGDFEAAGYGNLPVCIAKTQYSFSTDATLLGAPEGHVLEVREARLAAGAGFVVLVCGAIMTMPGLPKVPAAETIDVSDDGVISGLF